METVNNMASAAAKAVFGDTTKTNETGGQEPISGKQGDVAKGEPFDKGNADQSTVSATATPATEAANPIPTTTSSTAPVPASTSAPSAEPASSAGVPITDAVGKPSSSSGGVSDGTETAKHVESLNLDEPSTGTDPSSSAAEFSKTTGTAAESSHVPDNPSTELKAKDAPADTSAGQGDVRAPEDPQTNPKNNPTDVDDTGDGPNEAQKLDGPGPQPLEDVARKHGGDAAGEKKPAAGEEGEDESGPGAKSTGEGTGEKWVKTTGLQADGGDFDATKPGAGREAERLLEEKGIHREAGPKKSSEDGGKSDDKSDHHAAAGDDDHESTESGGKKKKSPFAKIKEKLKH